MKKILLSVIILFTFSGGYALATSVNGNYEGSPIVKIISGGKELTGDVPAVIYHDHTLVPIYLLNQLGVKTEWNAQDYSVTVTLPTPMPTPVLDLTQDQLNDIAKNVYEIFGSTSDPTIANQGSGFMLDGYMITCAHVAGDSDYVQVQINGQWQKIYKSQYAFVDKDKDIMGFKVSGAEPLSYDADIPKIGDKVYAIGWPGQKMTITQGSVTFNSQLQGIDTIMDTAEVEGGSSGGILLNSDGQIIGITNAGFETNGQFISYAIPIHYVIDEINDLK